MTAPRNDNLERMHEAFREDHERLRQSVLASLARYPDGHRPPGRAGQVRQFIGVTIMRNQATQLATATVMAVAVALGLRGINGSSAWAKVVAALNRADDIHVVTRVTRPSGRVEEYRTWLKDGVMYRSEEPDELTIDDGKNRLALDLAQKTAQLGESRSGFKDYLETGNLEIILLFKGKDTPFTAAELTEERTATERVYKVTYRDIWEGKAWVDARSHLPLRIEAVVTEAYRNKALDMLVVYDYTPISLETFDLAVPPGYTELSRAPARFFSGKVVDGEGQPVIGAEVVASNERIRGKTDEGGAFAIKLHPDRGLGGLPMVVRAMREDDPSRVAWTLLRNPRHELRPLFIPDDGKSKLEQGRGVDIHLVDAERLREQVPHHSGTVVFEDDADRHPSAAQNMVLTLRPASVVTGRVTDGADRPIADAVVWIDRMELAAGTNAITLHRFGQTERELEDLAVMDAKQREAVRDKTFAITGPDGSYKLGHLLDGWEYIRLTVTAKGYVTVGRRIYRAERNDFVLVPGDITIRGTVIDDHGQPLVGREVEIDVDSDEEHDLGVEEAVIDAEGRFELPGVPAVAGLELQIRADEKPRGWDRNELTRGRKFVYYLMIEEPIALESGKKEYFVEIIPERPDITLEIEVTNAGGGPLVGVPVGVCSPGNTERVWYVTKLASKTDGGGRCTIGGVPRIQPLDVWIGEPPARQMHYWASDSQVNLDVKHAVAEYRDRYLPTVVSVEWTAEENTYPVSVTLETYERGRATSKPD